MLDPTLTENQRLAASHTDGPCLVIAGAGTGKTKVITERIAYLILEKKVEPEAIVALTFTDKAAGEMQERLDQLLPYGMFGTTLSTFHSFCHDLLKRHSYVVGVDANARLVGKAEEISLLRSSITELPLHHYLPPANPVSFLRELTTFVDRAKEEQITPAHLEEHGRAQAKIASDDAEREAAEKTLELAAAYKKILEIYREANILTYADLINLTLTILKKSPHARKLEQERYSYFLIDEFQDTNTSQAEIAYLLAGDTANIFVVGDDDQAIYRFRGANITNILNFKKRYPHAATVALTDNFRSGQAILDASYKLIQHNNPHRLEVQENLNKQLISHQETSFPVTYLHYSHSVYEEEGIAQEVQRLIQEEGYEAEDIAILGRGHNHLTGFEQELLQHGIPVHRHKDGTFYEQPVIERALSYLRFLVKPHDSFNLFFLLSEPPFAIPVSELREVNVRGRRVNNSLWEQLALEDSLGPELGEARRYLSDQLLQEKNRRPTEALRLHIQGYNWEKQLIEAEDSQALNQLNALYFEARNFELLHRPVVLSQYLTHIDDLLASGEDVRVENEFEETSTGVTLMTVHASKGLEFKVVFVVNMVMDRFPGRNMGGGLPMPEELVTSQIDNVKYEEERRLAYVAFTRAKERLYLTNAKRYEQNKRDKKPSVFIQEALQITEELAFDDKPLTTVFNSVQSVVHKPTFALPTSYTASALEAFESSPDRYLKEYIYRLTTEDNAHASFGTCIHEVLHCYFAALKSKEPFDIDAQYERCWKAEGYENKEHEKRWKAEGLTAIKKYLAQFPSDFLPDRLEVPVELVLENNTRVIGKVDRIDRNDDGSITIIDYKTGRSEAKTAAIKDNLPLAIYAAALNQHKEKVATIQLHYIMTGQILSLPITLEFLTATLLHTEELIKKIEHAYKTGEFPVIETWYR